MTVLSDEYFEKIHTMRTAMEEYNNTFTQAFEEFLLSPSQDSILSVIVLRNNALSSSCANTYSYINCLYSICDIVLRELGVNYLPVTNGTHTYMEAIDKYRKVVFMTRRHEFFTKADDSFTLEEAINYILYEDISPVALSYAILNELGGDPGKASQYWQNILYDNGRIKDSLLLKRLVELSLND